MINRIQLFVLIIFLAPKGWSQAPLTQDSIKKAFSCNYHLWMQIRDRTWEVDECSLLEIPAGAYYRSLDIIPVEMDGIAGLSLYRIEKIGEDIYHNGNTIVSSCSDLPHRPIRAESFLIGVTKDGSIRYLSGDLILNEVRHFMINSKDFAKMAEIRLYYLQVEDIRFYKKKQGKPVYSAYSRELQKTVFIQFESRNPDIFSIMEKGRFEVPMMTVGISSN